MSPATALHLLLTRHEWNGAAILFGAFGLILSIFSIEAAFVSGAFGFACAIVAIREHCERERVKAWGEAEFRRLIDDLMEAA